jgi:hypothetical protein
MSRFLVYLPALACPLLMLVCMAGMRRMGGPPAGTEKAPPPASTADRIARLERELAELRAQQHDLPADPRPVPAAPAPARSHADPPSAQQVS